MLNGHGDDIHNYRDIRINFSSNVYNHFDHSGLFAYLTERLPRVVNYPEPTPLSLEAELAEMLHLKPSEVMVTNGATEAIYLIAQAYAGASSSIIQPTFSEYEDACRMFQHQLEGEAENLIWLCNPNNPTGLTLGREDLLGIVGERQEVTYVIDASYAPFTQEALLSPAEAAHLPNVLMLHSMTKEFAIPGLRLGYITGNAALLYHIGKFRMPWSVNQMAQDAGHYLLKHRNNYRLDLPTLLRERERVAAAINGMEGLEALPSDTHILLCRTRWGTAHQLKERLARQAGILIRDASNFQGLDNSFFRIAVQTEKENDELLAALAALSRDALQSP